MNENAGQACFWYERMYINIISKPDVRLDLHAADGRVVVSITCNNAKLFAMLERITAVLLVLLSYVL